MRTKPNVLAITEQMLELVESSKLSLEKHTIDPVQLHKNLKTIAVDLERIIVLVKRESDDK